MGDDAYNGDYRCEAHEGEERGDRCPLVAAQVWREPFTPGHFPVRACAEHAEGLQSSGYYFDAEGSLQLCRDTEREAEQWTT